MTHDEMRDDAGAKVLIYGSCLGGDPAQARDAALEAIKVMHAEMRRLENSLTFYRLRCEALQRYQKALPEPHRTAICNILANGRPGPY